ncbi:hypothetical protein ACFSX9_14010 [Flavobacterium ardleyense]|uniref:Lipoprotein n=1 Tax=Flavobacterium ardleyense TaxID=2038737 RepID=A0ABW5ZAF1_9FLAO
MKIIFSLICISFMFFSCGPKFYSKKDYTFYDRSFVLNENSALQTNGFYVLESTWSKRDDIIKKPTKFEVYKFFKEGQSNLLLVDSLKTSAEYVAAMQKQFQEYGKNKNEYTLFQGYFKVQESKIIIQEVNVVIRQFTYRYGYIENDKLIMVKSTTEGKGQFNDKYFTDYFKSTYVFVPYEKADAELVPNW